MGKHGVVTLRIGCLVILCMVLSSAKAIAAIRCNQVESTLNPCLGYVTNGGAVTQACCSGVRSLNKMAKTTQDRQAVCRCLTCLDSSVLRRYINRANELPAKCGVKAPSFKNIHSSNDCNRVR